MIDELNRILSSGMPRGVYAETGLVSCLLRGHQNSETLAHDGMLSQRRCESIAGRVLVRRGLASFGVFDCDVPRAEDGSPVWPTGFCGSISHKSNLCAVVLAHTSDYIALGIDVEKDQSLPYSVWKYFLNPEEHSQHSVGDFGRIANLLFSCKEAAYKCLQPHSADPISFLDIRIQLSPNNDMSYRVRGTLQNIDLEGKLYQWNDVVLVWMIYHQKMFDFRTSQG